VGTAIKPSRAEALDAARDAVEGSAVFQAGRAAGRHQCAGDCVMNGRITWRTRVQAFLLGAFPSAAGWQYMGFAFARFEAELRCRETDPLLAEALEDIGDAEPVLWEFRSKIVD
jgi:hypothetical protein